MSRDDLAVRSLFRRRFTLIVAIALVCLATDDVRAQVATSSDTFDSGGKQVSFELFEPSGAGPYPGVVILPGTFGLNPPWGDDMRSFGKGLAEQGIVAAIINYFDRTETPPGLATTAQISTMVVTHGDEWNAAINDGIGHLAAMSNVDRARIGLIGFSLGGNRALNVAVEPGRTIAVARVVDFFGPVTSIPVRGDLSTMPLVQIHHGRKDKVVKVAETEKLVEKLTVAGKVEGTDFWVIYYSKCFEDCQPLCHGFCGDNLRDSRVAALKFLKDL